MSNALLKQQEDFVKNAASKLIPGGNNVLQHTNGSVDPSNPSANGGAAAANTSTLAGAPDTNGATQQNGHQNQNIIQKTVSGVEELNKQALDGVHNVAHGVVEHIPGGHQASQLTHGLVQNFIPGSGN